MATMRLVSQLHFATGGALALMVALPPLVRLGEVAWDVVSPRMYVAQPHRSQHRTSHTGGGW